MAGSTLRGARTLCRAAIEDELMLGVEWPCNDASLKLYDLLYYASYVRYLTRFLDSERPFLAFSLRKTTYAIIVSSSSG